MVKRNQMVNNRGPGNHENPLGRTSLNHKLQRRNAQPYTTTDTEQDNDGKMNKIETKGRTPREK